MYNPFEAIEKRLSNIENLILDIKHGDKEPQPEPSTGPGTLTRKEVSEKLRVSLVTIDKLTRAGILQSYRLGGKVFYKTSEVEKSMQAVKNAKYKRG